MSKLHDYLAHKPELEGETYLWKQSAAAALEVSEKTLERAAKAGKIKAIEKNRKIMYLIEDLATFETEQATEYQKPVIEADTPRQTQTDTEIMSMQTTLQMASDPSRSGDMQQRLVFATVERAEADAKKSYFEGNLTFALDEAAETFGLSIVDLKKSATTFKGKNQKLMITKKNLESYLEKL